MEPSTYRATECLRDGRQIEIRAVRHNDRPKLDAAIQRMSDETLYRRFFYPKRYFSEAEKAYYTDVDFVNHVSLVAALDEDGQGLIVGACGYVVTQPGVAEVAFAVDDQHQRLGLGTLLMRHLTAIARAAGLKRFIAEVLAHNAAMLKVFQQSGLRVKFEREHEVVLVTLELV
jgi:RimJ/RimL family protein N-acetyltransferase